MLFRQDGEPEAWVADDLNVLARAASEPVPPALDDVDRLFLGGPDALNRPASGPQHAC